MFRRKIAIALLAIAWVVASQVAASAAISRYIDGPRNEWGIAVEPGYHAWTVDSAAHPFIDVSALGSDALLGNIDAGNATFGDVLVFYAGGGLGTRQWDLKLWDLANHEALHVPAGINTPTADERTPSISGDYLLFKRVRPSGADRLLLYQLSTQTFTTIATTTPAQQQLIDVGRVNGDYVVYDVCSYNSVCNVFRYQISTATQLEAPKPGPSNYVPTVMPDGTVYFVNGSARYCGHHTRLMKWTGSGGATELATLPETIESGTMDGYDDGVTTTLYFTRVRCAAGDASGIYRLPNV